MRDDARAARHVAVAAALALIATVSPTRSFARDEPPGLDADDVPSIFAIRKSTNRNRVDYGIRVDRRCAPTGSEPVTPYWRMLERGDRAVERLRAFERRAYGIGSQRVVRGEEGGAVHVRFRALGDRDVWVRTAMRAARCEATAFTTIAGTPARLEDVYVVLAGPMSVDHVELRGTATGSGEPVSERVRR